MNEYDDCCICLCNIINKDPDNFLFTCCNKNIHRECLFKILILKNDLINNIDERCPLCRTLFCFTEIFTIEYITKKSQINLSLKKITNFIINKYYTNNSNNDYLVVKIENNNTTNVKKDIFDFTFLKNSIRNIFNKIISK
jgi:hypothetical protein